MPAVTAVAIMRHLPETSALARLGHPWTFDRYIAVKTLEEVDALIRVTLATRGVKRDKLPEPLIIPRPGDKPEPPKPKRAWLADLVGHGDGVTVRMVA